MERLEFAGWAVGQRLRLLDGKPEAPADRPGGHEVEKEGCRVRRREPRPSRQAERWAVAAS